MNQIREGIRVEHLPTSSLGIVVLTETVRGQVTRCLVHMDVGHNMAWFDVDELVPYIDVASTPAMPSPDGEGVPGATDYTKQSPIDVARSALAIAEFVNGELVNLLLHALHTDGAHHKQWYLERALRILRPYETGDWEPGIKP